MTVDEYKYAYNNLKIKNTNICLHQNFIKPSELLSQISNNEFNNIVINQDDIIIQDYEDDEEQKSYNHHGYKILLNDFCDDNQKCKITGIIDCMGIVIKRMKGEGLIGTHFFPYETDNETDNEKKIEFKKLKHIQKIMSDKGWDWNNGTTMKIYMQKLIPKKEKKRNEVIKDIVENLKIPKNKIEIIYIDKCVIEFK
tara:strand:- start:1876 stop:2466 length:591 start_codon:yes stop_codon:yes gene_type:complete